MKKFFMLAAAVIAACLVYCSCDSKNIVIKVEDLPQAAQSFIKTHFSDTEASYILKDGREYEIRLANGWELEFDSKGEWEKVDCNRDAVPQSVIATLPEELTSYLKANFGEAYVTEISRDRSGYEVELSNGLDLEFSAKGKFKRIDD